MASCRQLGFDVTENCTIRSADPENPTLVPNMKCIGSPVAEIWPFAYLGAYGTPILEGRGGHHHHYIYSPIITSSQQYRKNSHTIGGLPEKPYRSLTGRLSKKNKLSTNNTIIQYTKYKQKTTLCKCNKP